MKKAQADKLCPTHRLLRLAMSTKPLWPTSVPNPSNIHEHLILSLHTNQAMIKAIEGSDKKDKRSPIDILLKHLEAVEDILVRLQDHLPEKDILQEIHTLKEIVKKNQEELCLHR